MKKGPVPIPIEIRFWKYVKKTPTCWAWDGCTNETGYGLINCPPNKNRKAHRISWEMKNGPIPSGLWILHKCDNPPCVNPEHLFLGNRIMNMKDMVQKGRSCIGERHGQAILRSDQIVVIREKYLSGNFTQQCLANEFKVHIMTINAIVNRKNWAHI